MKTPNRRRRTEPADSPPPPAPLPVALSARHAGGYEVESKRDLRGATLAEVLAHGLAGAAFDDPVNAMLRIARAEVGVLATLAGASSVGADESMGPALDALAHRLDAAIELLERRAARRAA